MKHKERLIEAQAAARVAQAALTEARTIFDAFRTSLQDREAGLRDLRTHAQTAREALGQHEMALREREIAMEHLLTGVREKFRGLELGRVIGDYHLRPAPDGETRTRIQELSGLIDRMGSVNLDAMREHEEAEKRYEFYTTQKADLDKALADLERAIQQMNRESKKLFTDTFVAVNTRFQELFPKMFRGGRAELRLTNPEDMLETGIDIIAQPPGKKLSSIELMSGGEKALTAVSLIFAIFSIRPSPFCILDEVDAPLDEANVGRYCEAIREMTDRSQFILITHIKKTMQMVDILHGVTMGEPGVSRLVERQGQRDGEVRQDRLEQQRRQPGRGRVSVPLIESARSRRLDGSARSRLCRERRARDGWHAPLERTLKYRWLGTSGATARDRGRVYVASGVPVMAGENGAAAIPAARKAASNGGPVGSRSRAARARTTPRGLLALLEPADLRGALVVSPALRPGAIAVALLVEAVLRRALGVDRALRPDVVAVALLVEAVLRRALGVDRALRPDVVAVALLVEAVLRRALVVSPALRSDVVAAAPLVEAVVRATVAIASTRLPDRALVGAHDGGIFGSIAPCFDDRRCILVGRRGILSRRSPGRVVTGGARIGRAGALPS